MSVTLDLILCLFLDPVTAVDFALVPGNNIQLPCQLHSNLAQVHWRFSHKVLESSDKYYIYSGGLLVLNASESDAGAYTCDSVEQIHGRTYNRTMAVYHLQLYPDPAVVSPTPSVMATESPETMHTLNTVTTGSVPETSSEEDPLSPETQNNIGRVGHLEVAVSLLSLLCLSLIGIIIWIWSRGHWKCLTLVRSSRDDEARKQSADYMHIQNRTSEIHFLGPETRRPCSGNNNHSVVDFKGNGENHFTPMANISSLDGLGYIHDESEI